MNRTNKEIIDEILTKPLHDIRRIRIAIHNFEKDQKKTNSTTQVAKVVDSRSMDLAKLLYDLMIQNHAVIKEPNLNDFANDIEKLHRIDKQPYELIEAAIAWSQDNGFWKRNIRSGGALRRHFEKICIQARFDIEDKKMKGGKVHSV